jgi:hypothetical protein
MEVFDENGALTREFLLERGYCCGNGCRNCPYDYLNVPPWRRDKVREARAQREAQAAGTLPTDGAPTPGTGSA